MQPGETRRTERILYRGPVELLSQVTADGGLDHLHAETVDLGRGGMRIEAGTAMPVGAAVTCKLVLDGREASLAGRVAWATGVADQHGIGICFEALSFDESALLRQMVERSRAGYRAVELRFADLPQPIWARARRRTRGLQLSAALPILARGSELSFRLDAEGPLLIGRVADAALREDDTQRRIEIDVDVVERDSVRFRRNARYGFPSEVDAEPLPMAPQAEPATVSATPIEAGPAAHVARGPHLGSLLLSALTGAAVGLVAAGWQGPAPAHAARERATSIAPAATGTAVASRHAALIMKPERIVAEPARPLPPPPEPTLQLIALAPPVPLEPELHSSPTRTRVRVPFEGTLELMHTLQWASPPALTVYLPAGRIPLPSAVFRARSAGISSVAVLRKDGEQLLRVKLAARLTHYAVNLDSGRLELSLVHE